MPKKRVYEIAKEEGLPSSFVLQRLLRAGVPVKTASSTVDVAEALNIINPNRYPKPEPKPEPPPRPARQPARPKARKPPAEGETTTPAPATAAAPAAAAPAAAAPAAAAPAEAARAEAPPEPRPEAEAPAPAPAEVAPPAAAEAAPPATKIPAAEPAPAPEPPAPAAAEPPAAPPAPEPPAAETPAPVAETPAAPPPEPAPAPAPAAAAPAEAPAAPSPAPEEAPAPAAETPPPEAAPAPEPAAPAAPPARVAPAPEPAADAPARPAPAPRPAEQGPSQPGRGTPPAPGPGAPGRQELAPAASANRPPRAPDRSPGSRPGPAPARPGAPAGAPGDGGGRRPGGAPTTTPGGGPGGARGRGKRRRVIIDAQAGRRPAVAQGRNHRGGPRPPRPEEREPDVAVALADLPPVEIRSGATVKDVAEAIGVGTPQIIKHLMTMGEMATITQSLSDEAIELVAEEVGRRIRIVTAEEEDEAPAAFEDAPEDLRSRAPVVTIMGHVDHGKTSLLDAIRSTEVAAGEAGGITQHIGAYQVRHDGREITFLDTPGHEAFTAMRARGARITDVAVIVVAADDGVMPQTVEAIDHAKAAAVPFMVAINKVDKPDANPDRVRQELTRHEVMPSEWGGKHEFVEVSALQKLGLESLLETVLLVADADADPKANPTAPASGTVIESRLDPGRGPVCTLLVQRGTLHIGDVLLAGDAFGRVRAMTDFKGDPLTQATPSVPVEVLGLDSVPDAGEKFRVVENERTARQLASERSQRLRSEELANKRPVSLEDLFARISEGGLKELNIIIKGDVQGSVGALADALAKVEQTEVRLRVIHTGVGAITESDVMLASASQAIIIGFNVRPRPEAKLLSEREGVDVRTYRVIYRAIEDVRDALVGLLEPDIVEEVVGQLEVRATFRSSKLGTIAGCYVTDGIIRRSSNIRLVRDGTVVHEGTIASLKRFQEDVREVAAGFECGVLIEDYNDVKDGDQIEAFERREVARTAQAGAPARE